MKVYADDGTLLFERCSPNDFSKLKIIDGVIHYKLYDQNGKFVSMTCADTHDNRQIVSWIQIHDRM